MASFPNSADFAARRATNPDQSEVVRQRFYDYQLYPTAGTTQLTFFALPQGQGLTTAPGATAGTAKTVYDTNLVVASTLPSGSAFMIESVEVIFQAGSVSTANTFTMAVPSLFNATAAAAVTKQLDDTITFYNSGKLRLNILQKDYLVETPLFAFPPKQQYRLDGAIASNSATTAEVGFVNMRIEGRPYYLEPTISLQPAVNFNVFLEWPGAVATPSGFNARVGVILDGYFMRASQ